MSRVMGIKCHFILQNNRRENATESTRLFGYIIHLGYDAHTSLAVDDQLVGVFVVLVWDGIQELLLAVPHTAVCDTANTQGTRRLVSGRGGEDQPQLLRGMVLSSYL